MDIEGYEFELVSGLRWQGSCHYPRQIAMEVHYNVRRVHALWGGQGAC